MNVIKKIMGTIFFVLMVAPIFGQDFNADLKKAYALFGEAENFYTKIDIKTFEDNVIVEEESTQTYIFKKGDQYHYKMGQQAYLVNAKHVILVDHFTKVISYKKNTGMPLFQNQVPLDQLDEFLKQYESIEFVGVKGNNKHYAIKVENNGINQIDMVLDKTDGAIKKIVYFYDEKIAEGHWKVEMEFVNLSLNPTFKSSEFSSGQYLSFTTEKPSVAKAFKDYHLIDNQ